jgi:hypothetical protein
MARKRSAPRVPKPAAIRGRPPLPPRTTLARWIRAQGLTVASFADKMAEMAPSIGLPTTAAPKAKTLLDAVNARHWPSATTMFLIRHVTDGDVDLEHWVRDLYTPDA